MDEYEDFSLNLSLDESNSDQFSLDLLRSDHKRKDVMEDDRKKEDTHEGLRDDKERVLLEYNQNILKLVWKKDADGYLWEIKGCSLPAKKNRKIKPKKELKKSVSQISSIVNMFLAQKNKKQSFS